MANKSMKPTKPVITPSMTEEEKNAYRERQLAQIKMSVSQSVLNNLCAGKGVMSEADCEQVAKNALLIADKYIEHLFSPKED